jgi:hypothetical protein
VIATTALAVTACGSGASGPATSTAAPTAAVPRVIDCSFDPPAVRPAHMILACADLGARVEQITWKSWGPARAEGDGTERDNTCDPNCAAGHFVTKPVHIVLSDPTQPGNVFTKVTTIDAAGKSLTRPLMK